MAELTVAATTDARLQAESTLEATLEKGSKGKKVSLVQEWLGLNGVSVPVDGGFSDATERAVREFQGKIKRAPSGKVDQALVDTLAQPMLRAVAAKPSAGLALGDAIVEIAKAHLQESPLEIGGDNRGPWVRLYMDGKQGDLEYWCAGFVSYIIGQALGANKRPLKKSVSCVDFGTDAETTKRLVGAKSASGKVLPGWVFLKIGADGYEHTGIVTSGDDKTFTTIEGNTNDGKLKNGKPDNNGYEVTSRIRKFGKYDFVNTGPIDAGQK
jgi:hypothetical protein